MGVEIVFFVLLAAFWGAVYAWKLYKKKQEEKRQKEIRQQRARDQCRELEEQAMLCKYYYENFKNGECVGGGGSKWMYQDFSQVQGASVTISVDAEKAAEAEDPAAGFSCNLDMRGRFTCVEGPAKGSEFTLKTGPTQPGGLAPLVLQGPLGFSIKARAAGTRWLIEGDQHGKLTEHEYRQPSASQQQAGGGYNATVPWVWTVSAEGSSALQLPDPNTARVSQGTVPPPCLLLASTFMWTQLRLRELRLHDDYEMRLLSFTEAPRDQKEAAEENMRQQQRSQTQMMHEQKTTQKEQMLQSWRATLEAAKPRSCGQCNTSGANQMVCLECTAHYCSNCKQGSSNVCPRGHASGSSANSLWMTNPPFSSPVHRQISDMESRIDNQIRQTTSRIADSFRPQISALENQISQLSSQFHQTNRPELDRQIEELKGFPIQ